MAKQIKISLFWRLQITGWIVLAVGYVLLYYRSYLSDSRALLGLSLTYITGFVTTIFLRLFFKKIGYRKRSISFISFVILFGTLVTANIWFWFDAIISQIAIGGIQIFDDFSLSNYVGLIWSKSFIILLWSTIYFSIKLWDDYIDEKLRAEKADALAHKAQLQMLRYQLNPHFLFNSLNSIRALIEEDQKKAKSMITELSEFLRYSLVNKNLSYVSLNSELEAMEHYFVIEKTRFEEKLEVSININPKSGNIQIPSFLIHPIIENAIKYGMKTTILPLIITIKTDIIENDLCIEICNSGKWFDENNYETSTGTGLNNVRQRLLNAYPNNHSFEIIKNNENVCVRIKIFNVINNDK